MAPISATGFFSRKEINGRSSRGILAARFHHFVHLTRYVNLTSKKKITSNPDFEIREYVSFSEKLAEEKI